MTGRARNWIGGAALVAAVSFAGATAARPAAGHDGPPNELAFSNPGGVSSTLTAAGGFERGNPFFDDLGSNGRSCSTCHRPAQAWSIAPAELRERFEQTRRTRSDLSHQRRVDLRRGGRRDPRAAAAGVQPAADEGAHSRRSRRARGGGVRDRRRRRSLQVRRTADVGVHVSTAAADDQSRVPEYGHVGRPRDGPGALGERRPRRAGARRDAGSCAGNGPLARSAARDRRLRARTVHGAVARPGRRQAGRRARAGRAGLTGAAAVLHRHQRSAGHAAGRCRAHVSARRASIRSSSRCSAPGRAPAHPNARRSRAARPSSTRGDS